MLTRLRTNTAKAVAALLLILLGLVCAGLYRVVSGTENEVYAPGAVPPNKVHVTVNNTYDLSVPGGVPALLAHGISQLAKSDGTIVPGLQCEWSKGGAEPQTLTVDAEAIGTKAVNTVGHFTAPVTGNLHIDCTRWGTMFVSDADHHAGDRAGGFLVLCVITLTVGGALGLSALRVAMARRTSTREAFDDDGADVDDRADDDADEPEEVDAP
jgi:hypothetical protein